MGSCDGVTWQEIQTRWFSDFYWAGMQLLKMRGKKISYLFSPTDLRYLKLRQEGMSVSYYWSIYELEVIDEFINSPSPMKRGGLTSAGVNAK